MGYIALLIKKVQIRICDISVLSVFCCCVRMIIIDIFLKILDIEMEILFKYNN